MAYLIGGLTSNSENVSLFVDFVVAVAGRGGGSLDMGLGGLTALIDIPTATDGKDSSVIGVHGGNALSRDWNVFAVLAAGVHGG